MKNLLFLNRADCLQPSGLYSFEMSVCVCVFALSRLLAGGKRVFNESKQKNIFSIKQRTVLIFQIFPSLSFSFFLSFFHHCDSFERATIVFSSLQTLQTIEKETKIICLITRRKPRDVPLEAEPPEEGSFVSETSRSQLIFVQA